MKKITTLLLAGFVFGVSHQALAQASVEKGKSVAIEIPVDSDTACNIEVTRGGEKTNVSVDPKSKKGVYEFAGRELGEETIRWEGKMKFRGLKTLGPCRGDGAIKVVTTESAEAIEAAKQAQKAEEEAKQAKAAMDAQAARLAELEAKAKAAMDAQAARLAELEAKLKAAEAEAAKTPEQKAEEARIAAEAKAFAEAKVSAALKAAADQKAKEERDAAEAKARMDAKLAAEKAEELKVRALAEARVAAERKEAAEAKALAEARARAELEARAKEIAIEQEKNKKIALAKANMTSSGITEENQSGACMQSLIIRDGLSSSQSDLGLTFAERNWAQSKTLRNRFYATRTVIKTCGEKAINLETPDLECLQGEMTDFDFEFYKGRVYANSLASLPGGLVTSKSLCSNIGLDDVAISKLENLTEREAAEREKKANRKCKICK